VACSAGLEPATFRFVVLSRQRHGANPGDKGRQNRALVRNLVQSNPQGETKKDT